MKAKWNFLMVLVLLATLAGGNTSPAQAQGVISDINPVEGTVGTQVTLTGLGFGDKQGEVLLGTEKSKILAWSDTEITFLVDKPQHPDEYTITVLLQGDKKPAEPMTFGSFAIRRPQIAQGDTRLIRDGNTVTILGQFFGDKKGTLRVGYETGGVVVVADPKILDWSMNTIRFELPDGLTAWFVLSVRSEVGTDLALLFLDGGVVGSVPPAPGWKGGESWENANGIYYKGGSQDNNFYVFSNTYNPGYSDDYRIKASIFHPGDGSFVSISPPKGETEVPIQPLVVGDTLWVFHTGHMWTANVCCTVVWYETYYDNGTLGTWDPAGWKSIPNVSIFEGNTVAPVYDPRNHRISVYYEYGHVLRWVYTDDFGAHWSDNALVGGGVPVINNFVSAIYWPSDTTTALVASTGQVIAVNNGEYRGSIGHLTNDFWRPSLVDLGGQTALLYQNHAQGEYDNTPMMTKLNYAINNGGIWSWSDSTPLVTLPNTGILLTEYNFLWSPKGAVTQVENDRHLYVLYGAQLKEYFSCLDIESCAGDTLDRWYLLDEETLGPEVVLPQIDPTAFSQVSAGEQHACAIKADGTLECWGNNNYGQLNHAAGTFNQISAGNWLTCGVKMDQSIECWGKDDYGLVSNHPSGNNFIQVTAGLMVACALKQDGAVVCWGYSGAGLTTSQTGMTQISAGQWHTCGIKNDGFVHCWGDDGGTGRVNNAPTDKKFIQISAAAWHTCGITDLGDAVCWGHNDEGRVSPVPVLTAGLTYQEVSAGRWHTCALVSDGSIRCWGSNADQRVSSRPTTGKFTHIEAGILNTCATREDGGITCWGNNSAGQGLPPF